MQVFFEKFFIFGKLHHYIKKKKLSFVQLFSHKRIFMQNMQKNMHLYSFLPSLMYIFYTASAFFKKSIYKRDI